jgi:hypothetical protein
MRGCRLSTNVWGRVALRWRPSLAVVIASVVAAACSGSSAPAHGPIAECEQYAQAVVRCSGPAVTPPTFPEPVDPAKREHLRELCSVNLQRISQACR